MQKVLFLRPLRQSVSSRTDAMNKCDKKEKVTNVAWILFSIKVHKSPLTVYKFEQNHTFFVVFILLQPNMPFLFRSSAIFPPQNWK